MNEGLKEKRLGKRGGDLTEKQRLWLKTFFETMNATEAAKRAYTCSDIRSAAVIGCKNFNKLKHIISKWLEEIGLSDEALKLRLVELLNATEKKAFQYQGEIFYSDEMAAWSMRAKGLEMALKLKGLLTNKLELSGRVESIHGITEKEKAVLREITKKIAEKEKKNA